MDAEEIDAAAAAKVCLNPERICELAQGHPQRQHPHELQRRRGHRRREAGAHHPCRGRAAGDQARASKSAPGFKSVSLRTE